MGPAASCRRNGRSSSRDADGRPAAAALNEVGGYSMTARRPALLHDPGGREGHRVDAAAHDRHARPRLDAARRQRRASSSRAAVTALAADQAGSAGAGHPGRGRLPRGARARRGRAPGRDRPRGRGERARAIDVADPVLRRSIDAMLRDTVTPTVLHAGKKVNVIAGAGEAEIDVRTLPGTDQEALLAHLADVVGDGPRSNRSSPFPPIEWPADAEIVRSWTTALRAADPDGTPVPMMITPGTDAKALAQLGIPCYGFAPLRLEADVPFLGALPRPRRAGAGSAHRLRAARACRRSVSRATPAALDAATDSPTWAIRARSAILRHASLRGTPN